MAEALDVNPGFSPFRRGAARARAATLAIAVRAAIVSAALLGAVPATAEVTIRSTAGPQPGGLELPVVDGRIELTLDQAIELALERNLGLQVQRYVRTQTWYNSLQIK